MYRARVQLLEEAGLCASGRNMATPPSCAGDVRLVTDHSRAEAAWSAKKQAELREMGDSPSIFIGPSAAAVVTYPRLECNKSHATENRLKLTASAVNASTQHD